MVEPWFDFRITLGNVIESIVILTASIGFVWHLRYKISLLSLEIRYLKEEIGNLATGFKQIADILTKLAVQDTRINRIEQDMRELRHGDGLVLPRKRDE